ncbi:hypothetical protein CVT26_014621 [Gymnopilus dilepis]|uniref:Uncharacterized protein n=1 Tax=Gymnopilus dilepis TaxID=231916 RepID=A0A409VWN5_9AGAR|nr:hypothetical protein CVT26_014621 [Gymnopilus dilepis]
MKLFCVLASIISVAVCQVNIGAPQPGAILARGQQFTVQLIEAPSVTPADGIQEVDYFVGIISCGSSACPSPSVNLGNLLFIGPYQPQGIIGSPPFPHTFQNLSLTVPPNLPTGAAALQVQRVIFAASPVRFPFLNADRPRTDGMNREKPMRALNTGMFRFRYLPNLIGLNAAPRNIIVQQWFQIGLNHKMKSFCIVASLLAIAAGQVDIGAPREGDTLVAGQEYAVQFIEAPSVTYADEIRQIGFFVGIASCGSSLSTCPSPSTSGLGNLLYVGKYEQTGILGIPPLPFTYQNVTLTIPPDWPSGIAVLQVQRILFTASPGIANASVGYGSIGLQIENVSTI